MCRAWSRLIVLCGVGLLWGSPVHAAVMHWAADFNDSTALTPQTGFTAVPEPALTLSYSGSLPESGGGPSINFTVSSGTLIDSYVRNMPASASSTNLYRDGLQNRSSPMTNMLLTLSGLTANSNYSVRLWFYDYSFNNNHVQYYTNLTSGGAVSMGSLTNRTGATYVPTALYDSRYSMLVNLNASAAGDIIISMYNPSAASKINGFEITMGASAVPEPLAVGQLILGGLLVGSLRRWRQGSRLRAPVTYRVDV